MKPCNFPGRVEKRRLAAIARAEANGDKATVEATKAKLIGDASNVRTKKNRTGRARL